MMKIDELKQEIELIVKAYIRLEWNSTFEILQAFAGLDREEGTEQTLEYWEDLRRAKYIMNTGRILN